MDQVPRVDQSATINNEQQDAPPDFNEQTHYVPVKTIITAGNHLENL